MARGRRFLATSSHFAPAPRLARVRLEDHDRDGSLSCDSIPARQARSRAEAIDDTSGTAVGVPKILMLVIDSFGAQKPSSFRSSTPFQAYEGARRSYT